jgi:hypothetical protein
MLLARPRSGYRKERYSYQSRYYSDTTFHQQHQITNKLPLYYSSCGITLA